MANQMDQEIELNVETDKEIVEKILAQLYIEGKIKDDRLSKKELSKRASTYISQNNVTIIKSNEMPKAMLKYDLCFYMKREWDHRCTYFKINTAKIAKLVEKYPQLCAQETIVVEKIPKGFNFRIDHVLTTVYKKEALKFANKKCFVCNKIFYSDELFEEHLENHGTPFVIEAEEKRKNILKMTLRHHPDEAKFVCRIPHRQGTMIDRVDFVLPPNNGTYTLRLHRMKFCIEVDIFYGMLPSADLPYTILLFCTLKDKTSLLTQYLFTVDESFYVTHIQEEYSNSKGSVILNMEMFKNVKRARFAQLPEYYPSQIMMSLSKKNFTADTLWESEEKLRTKIFLYLENGLSENNYCAFWRTFVEMEDCAAIEQFSKHDKKRQLLFHIKSEHYSLIFPKASQETPKITKGTCVIITPTYGSRKDVFATVHQVKRNDVILALPNDKKQKQPRDQRQVTPQRLSKNTLYDVHFVCNRLNIQLERKAIDYVMKHNITQFFFPKTVPMHPNDETKDMTSYEWFNESVKTNPEQQSAIIHIVEKTSFPAPYILLGPPGTGKTTTIVETVCQIVKRDPNAHILISASSNDAVDVIALKLLVYIPKNSIQRVFASSKEDDLSSFDPKLVSNSNLRYGFHYYPHATDLAQYNVILTTLSVSGMLALAGIRNTFFSYVFIDECGSSSEPSTLVPIAGVITSKDTIHGQIILAGDPMQLGPVVLSDRAEPRLGISLLERLVDTGIYARGSNGKYNPRVMTKLLQNYRSHPKILEFSNEKFYNGELLALGKPETTQWACNWKSLPNKSIPILFENVIGRVERDNNSSSMYNTREVERVVHHIEKLLATEMICGREITANSIGVISPYKLQCNKIEDACRKKSWDIDVGSVERFQGQERPVIILSTVRSQTHSVGFLNNPKRLNVALTRAQALLIVVGNVNTLQTDATWRQFVDFCRENGLITEVVEEKPHNQKKSGKKTKNKARGPKIPVKEMQALRILSMESFESDESSVSIPHSPIQDENSPATDKNPDDHDHSSSDPKPNHPNPRRFSI